MESSIKIIANRKEIQQILIGAIQRYTFIRWQLIARHLILAILLRSLHQHSRSLQILINTVHTQINIFLNYTILTRPQIFLA